MRRFKLIRTVDVSGVSGTGYVAEGVVFKNGKCCLSWLSGHSSVNVYDSVEDMVFVHGHGDSTHVCYIDNDGTIVDYDDEAQQADVKKNNKN